MSQRPPFQKGLDEVCLAFLKHPDKDWQPDTWTAKGRYIIFIGLCKLGIIEKVARGPVYRLKDEDRLREIKKLGISNTSEWITYSATQRLNAKSVIDLPTAMEVVGKSILNSDDPARAFSAIVQSLGGYLRRAEAKHSAKQ